MLSASELAAIFQSPFPRIDERDGRSVLYRSATDPPMLIGRARDAFLLAKFASRPDVQRDIWTALLRIRWPEGVDISDIVLLEEFHEQAAAYASA